MPTYSYVAKNTAGQLVRSSIAAESRVDALTDLRKRGLTVVDLSLASDDLTAHKPTLDQQDEGRRRIGLLQHLRPVGLADISSFCRLLATSVNAGIPLRDSVEAIAEDMDNQALCRILRDVVDRLHEGQSFSEAVEAHLKVFGVVFVSLIRCAEEAGSMALTLVQLADYMERRERLRRKVQSVTAYPIFVFVFFFIVCFIMTIFVLPRFQGVFDSFDATLPLFTRIVFKANQIVLDNLGLILLGTALAVFLFHMFKKTHYGRAAVDAWKLKLPFLGEITRKYAIARLCRNLAIMLRGGVSVTSAVEITSAVTGNVVLAEALLAVKERILTGSDIAGSLRQDPQFPRLFVRMVSVGETSGQLPEVMNKLSDVYEDQVEGQITIATALFEPLIICFFGAVVLVLVLAIYRPVFTVASKV